MKKERYLAFIIFIVVVVFVVGMWFVIRQRTSELPPPRTFSEAGFRFSGALQENDDLAYELSTRELWPKVDEWMAGHIAKHCHEYPFENFSGGGRGNELGGSVDKFTKCKLENGDTYYFNIYDIEVELIDGKYLVTGWGEVEENVER